MANVKNPPSPEKSTAQDYAQAPIDTEPKQSPAEAPETPTSDSSADLVIVQFSQHWALYSAGETAGFDPDIAESLIQRNIAVKA